MNKRFKVAGAVAGGLAFSLVSLGGVAAAQSADDVSIIVENLPTAAEELASGLQGAANTLAETQSAEATSQAVGQTVVSSGSALVEGSEQFGALGLGLLLVNGVTQQALQPYLQAIDDPSTAGDLVDPEDATVLAENLQPFLDAEQASLADGLVHLLQGNVIEPPLGLGPAFWSSAVVGTLLNGFNATQDTSLAPLFQIPGVTSLVVGGALEPQVSELETSAAPVFEAAAPVTGPIIEALQGI